MLNFLLTSIIISVFVNICDGLPVGELTKVEEVDYGTTAILHCQSNDEKHNFMFWQLAQPKQGIVGPGNEYNKIKYDYEILSGKLFIKSVSTEEEGLYNCVSKGIRNDDINIRTVRMVVNKDWEDVYEHDASVNFFRVVIVCATLITLAGGSFLIYKNWKSRHPLENYLEQSDEEESAEELFSSPGPSTSKGSNIVLDKSFSDNAYDNQALLSTDFKGILNNSNK